MKQQKLSENYLEKIPKIPSHISWETDENKIVTLAIENKGVMNRIAQKLFRKPKISYIHLDEFGSFVWQLIDNETSISKMGDSVKEQFGEAAEPLYPRLAKYFSILESYGFVSFEKM
ncbi:MAG: PqqD family protein [Clostridia bacterium]|nr:PqqD family protein [Clostridia bacterium]